VSLFPNSPLFNEPTTAIAPTQNSKLVDTNPCDIDTISLESSFLSLFNLVSILSPSPLRPLSISISSPISPPTTIDTIHIRTCLHSSAPLIPIYIMQSANPDIIVSLIFSTLLFLSSFTINLFNNNATKLAITIVTLFIITPNPNILFHPNIYYFVNNLFIISY